MTKEILFRTFEDTWIAGLLAQWNISPTESFELITLSFYAVAKFFLIFCVPPPAVAIHFTLKNWEKTA